MTRFPLSASEAFRNPGFADPHEFPSRPVQPSNGELRVERAITTRPFEAATCEACGEIVSLSRERGDTSNPINTFSHSAEARFWHTGCDDRN